LLRRPTPSLFPYTTLFRSDARLARIAVTPKGTVAAVGMYSIDASSNNRSRFTDATADMPGLNPLHVTPYNVVSAEHMQALKKIRSEEHTSELQSPYDIVCR